MVTSEYVDKTLTTVLEDEKLSVEEKKFQIVNLINMYINSVLAVATNNDNNNNKEEFTMFDANMLKEGVKTTY